MQLPLKSKNVLFILVGVGLIFLAYILMSLENFKDATEGFSLALDVSPILIIAGHVVVAYGIVARFTGNKSTAEESADSSQS